MNKVCQQYLSDIKTLFPILGKPEKKYLTKLAESVEDYCAEENVTTIKEIYDGFGQPRDVMNTYLANIDPPELIKRIRLVRWIKRGVFVLLLAALIGVSIYGIYRHKNWQTFQNETIFFDETEISD